MRLVVGKLTPEAFARFGAVAAAPHSADGLLIGRGRNLRARAEAQLTWAVAQPATLPVTLAVMERHRFSSQSFVPCAADARWLVVVAPHAASGGGPDMGRACAFAVGGDQAITYAPDVWHHPLTSLDRPARMALLTFRDGGPDDEEFFALPEPVVVAEA